MNDEVQVIRGTYKGREGKVVQVYNKVVHVYRRKWVIHREDYTRESEWCDCENIKIGVEPLYLGLTH